MKKGFKITVKLPKIRRPVQKKPNTVMKSKKDYRRKDRNNNKSLES
jgi:hypothetical protein